MTDNIQRELGEISATLKGIVASLDEIKDVSKSHNERISALETARNILYGVLMAVSVTFAGVYHAIQGQIEQVTARILR